MTTAALHPTVSHALKGWEAARDCGSTQDQEMAAGRVLDAITKLPLSEWATICAVLAAAKGEG
jgi:hypothetical protein